MTKIVYAPHCARCGALINEEVAYYEDKVNVVNNSYLSSLYLITPYRCKNCGEMFDKIEIKVPRRIENKD
jgi:predicted Zn-ribbon and HTH transcriptional regulator